MARDTRTARLNVITTPDMADAIKKIAQAEGISLNEKLNRIVQAEIYRFENPDSDREIQIANKIKELNKLVEM